MNRLILLILILLSSSFTYADVNSNASIYYIPIDATNKDKFISYLNDEESGYIPAHWDKGLIAASLNDEHILKDKYDSFSSKEKFSALIAFIAQKNLGLVSYILKEDSELNFYSGGNITPISVAVHVGSKDIFEILLEKRADINFIPSNGLSIMSYAVLSEDNWFIERIMTLNGPCDEKTVKIATYKKSELQTTLLNYCMSHSRHSD